MEEFYTVKEVAKLLKLSTKTISRYIDAEKLEALWFGNRWRIKSDEIERFINEQQRKGMQKVR